MPEEKVSRHPDDIALDELCKRANAAADAGAEAYATALLRRYADHDPSCPEFKQKANRHNKGLVEDSAWPCNCGLAEILEKK